MQTSWTVGRIAGIPIRIHFSWLLILGLLSWSLATRVFPDSSKGWGDGVYWTLAIVASLLFFFAVLVHELSHALVARRRGLVVSSITLFVFGGVSQIESEGRTPGEEFWVAFAGPLASLAIGVICLGLTALGAASSPQLEVVAAYLAFANIAVGIFNLIPGFPLDGGRVLRAIVWRSTNSQLQGTAVALSVSRFVSFLMIWGGILATLAGAGLQGVWIALIGWFLSNAAGATSRQTALHAVLDGARVRDAMTTEIKTVVPALPVAALVEEYIVAGQQRGFPVFGGGKLWGIVTLTDVGKLPRERWAETPVEAIMTPRARLKTVFADTPIEEVFADLSHDRFSQVVVVERDGDKPAGLLTDAALFDFVRLRQLFARR